MKIINKLTSDILDDSSYNVFSLIWVVNIVAHKWMWFRTVS